MYLSVPRMAHYSSSSRNGKEVIARNMDTLGESRPQSYHQFNCVRGCKLMYISTRRQQVDHVLLFIQCIRYVLEWRCSLKSDRSSRLQDLRRSANATCIKTRSDKLTCRDSMSDPECRVYLSTVCTPYSCRI